MNDGMMRLLAAVGAFAAAVLAAYGALALADSGHLAAGPRRLRKYLSPAVQAPLGRNAGGKPPLGRQARLLLMALGRALEVKRISAGLELELLRADVPFRSHEYVGAVALLSVGGGAAVSILTASPVKAVVVGIAGAFLPMLGVSMRKGKRVAALNGQIADALGIMSNSLRAGFSFMQAMDMISRELPPPLSVEFGRATREIGLGASVEDALLNMAKRVPSRDLDLVITAVLIQRQVGGNLAEVTDKIAHTITDRQKIKGQIRTMTAQGKISGLILALLPFIIAAFLFSTNPDYIGPMFAHPIGKIMIAMALGGEALGALLIAKITKIEV